MAGIAAEESGLERSLEEVLSEQPQQLCQSGEALAEWRSSEQVENGSPSTSPSYFDTYDDDDGGPKPSELYGKYTWKIENFSQINKRELRSNAFEIGGYKWHILVYPQGCDVSNHLSLFLCVANHDQLLPGWSHFAQFTIAMVNKDPKKSKYSDTLHRFWKKEHDWGWKKFMELSKVLDGFVDADVLTIKAQVQVIRERADRPFRCLDRHYRAELVRVYLTNVEQICRRFVEERRNKLGKLLEDKTRWSSFCAFWLGMDQSSKRRMSREKTESILKVAVKHFFIEKEVTSTLVMDSLYSGLKALEGQNKGKKSKGKHLEVEERQVPIIHIEKDTFILVDDVLLLLERAVMEPLPPKDDKGPQNRTKDGAAGEEFNTEHDERRLTELGRRTIEIFVLSQIFSKIEVAYQEAVALKKQEELIREEEAAWLAEFEQKARRGAADKEKKSKKKQGKQKRNNRQGKDKGRDEKISSVVQAKTEQDNPTVEIKIAAAEPQMVFKKSDGVEEVSDVFDSVDCVAEVLPLESEDRDVMANWDTDTSEMHPLTEASSRLSGVHNGIGRVSLSAMDDTSSASPSDSFPFVTVTHHGNSHHHNNQNTHNRGRNHQGKSTSDRAHSVNEEHGKPFEAVQHARQRNGASQSSAIVGSMSQTVPPLKDGLLVWTKRQVVKKEEKEGSVQMNIHNKDSVDQEASGNNTACKTSPPRSSSKSIPFPASLVSNSKINSASDAVMFNKPSSDNRKPPDSSVHLAKSVENHSSLKSDPPKNATPKVAEKHIGSACDAVMFNKPSSDNSKQPDSSVHLAKSVENHTLKPDPPKHATPKVADKPAGQQMRIRQEKEKLPAQEVQAMADKPSVPPTPVISRPLSAPLVPGSRPDVVVVSAAQTAAVLARSISSTCQLGSEPTVSATPSYVPQSYRNAIMGVSAGSSSTQAQSHSACPVVNASLGYSQVPALASLPPFSPHSSDRMDPNPIKPSFSFEMANHLNMLQNRSVDGRCSPADTTSLANHLQSPHIYNPVQSRLQNQLPSEFPTCTSGRQGHGLPDEFPHLDIINELLDDEHGIGMVNRMNSGHQSFSNLNRHYSFPGESGFSNGLGLSASSCRFDKTQNYHDDLLLNGYGSPRRAYDTVRDMIPNRSPQPYVNGQIDGYMPNQWHIPGSDVSFMSPRNVDNNGYPYRVPEYQNLNVGINGFPGFQLSNGL